AGAARTAIKLHLPTKVAGVVCPGERAKRAHRKADRGSLGRAAASLLPSASSGQGPWGKGLGPVVSPPRPVRRPVGSFLAGSAVGWEPFPVRETGRRGISDTPVLRALPPLNVSRQTGNKPAQWERFVPPQCGGALMTLSVHSFSLSLKRHA